MTATHRVVLLKATGSPGLGLNLAKATVWPNLVVAKLILRAWVFVASECSAVGSNTVNSKQTPVMIIRESKSKNEETLMGTSSRSRLRAPTPRLKNQKLTM